MTATGCAVPDPASMRAALGHSCTGVTVIAGAPPPFYRGGFGGFDSPDE